MRGDFIIVMVVVVAAAIPLFHFLILRLSALIMANERLNTK